MYFGLTIAELVVFGLAAIIIIWALIKIIVEEKHAGKFFYWFLIAATAFGLWLWRSGNGVLFFQWVKKVIGTP